MSRGLFLVAGAALASLLAILLQYSVVMNSPISPDPLPLPPSPKHIPNNYLQSVVRLGEGRLVGPEDVCVGSDDALYTATRDGWIRRAEPGGGAWEEWKMIGGAAVLGIAASMHGGLFVCDADKGLLKVGDEGVTILASEANNTKIGFADDAIEGSDGSVYMSDASSEFGLDDWFLDVLQAKPTGRVVKYDPSTNRTSVLLSGLAFANGVALSSHQDFLVVCETWRFRCLKHWLKGKLKGKTEVFVDNLPGGPDNVNLAPDGSFWIALLQLRLGRTRDWIHRSRTAKRLIAAHPSLVEKMKTPLTRAAMVAKVAPDGRILRLLDDSDGHVMPFVTSALEYRGHLYLGSLATNFVGQLPLDRPETK